MLYLDKSGPYPVLGLNYYVSRLILLISLSFSFIAGVSSAASCQYDQRYIVGNRELLTGIEGHDVRLRAMIDTGSDMSSMDTRDIEVKTHTNGSKWVYFSVPIDDGFGKTVRLVRPLKQFIWVQTHSGKPVKRPVIEATIKLGPITTQTSFSLTEYSAFREKVLLGLNTLAGVTLVDPQAELLLQRCQLHGS